MGIAITLSRQIGAGGAEIACGVAAELGLRVIGREAVHEAIQSCLIHDTPLESEDEKPHLVRRALDLILGKPSKLDSYSVFNLSDPGILSTSLFSNEDYHRSVLESIVWDLTQSSNVLILGQAAQVILRNSPNTFHVRVVAPSTQRVETLQKRHHIDSTEAHRRIEASDRARAGHLKRHYGADIDDAKLYDLTVNTGSISIATATRLIVEAIETRTLGQREQSIAHQAIR